MSEILAAIGILFLLAAQLIAGMLTVYLIAAFAMVVGSAIGDLLRHKKDGNDC